MAARQEDFAFAEVVLRHGYATDEQVAECLEILQRVRGEMALDESLAGILVKKGYLASAQAHVVEKEVDPARAGKPKNVIRGYRLLERVGGGAMGSVYRARHLKLDVDVALKVLRVSLSSSATQIERLKREARLAAKLDHPNVVRSLDVGESHGFHYLAMEFVEGSTLRERLKKGRLKEKAALAIVRDVARALEHAHAHGVIHRDVKPGNIMLTLDGRPKLADFGLARGQGPSDLTLEQSSIGTPQYVAPEQMRRGSDATPKSDLFSLGASLYHMVTGRPPFAGDSLGEIVQNVLACRFPPPERLVPDLSLDALYVMHRLLRANPRERYPSATDLLEDLDRIDRGEPIAPAGFKGDYQAFLARRRRRRRTAGAIALVGVVALASVLVFGKLQRDRREARATRCRAVAATGVAGIRTLDAVAPLQERIAAMERAVAEADGCPTQTLRARLATARASVEALERAAAATEVGPDADFRSLDASLAALAPAWEGPQRAVAAAREELVQASEVAAKARYNRLAQLQSYDDAGRLVADLDAFVRDLDRRYLSSDAPWAGHARGAARLLRRLDEDWRRIEKDLGRQYADLIEQKQWRLAGGLHNQLAEAQRTARAPVLDSGNPLAKAYLDWLFRPTPRLELEHGERREWLALQNKVRTMRADEVVAQLDAFRTRAFVLEPEVVQAARRAHDTLRDAREAQGTLLGAARRNVDVWARRRYYDRARREAQIRVGTLLPGPQAEAARLRARGERLGRLARRFAERVGAVSWLAIPVDGEPIEVPGASVAATKADPDLYEARLSKDKAFTFRLEELDRATLERVLALDPKTDGALIGEFLQAEAQATDPRTAIALLDRARPFVRDTARVDALRADAAARAKAGEARARDLFASMRKAQKEAAYIDALEFANELRSYQWTRFGRDNKEALESALRDLRRQATGDLTQLRYGVPPDNFAHDFESGAVTFRFTGEFWTHAPKPPAGVDPDAWRRDQTEKFWRERWRREGAQGAFEDFYARATRQLRAWTGVGVLDGGGYVVAGDERANYDRWKARQTLVPATLAFPVRADRDWALEFTVRWPVSDSNRRGFPVYFAVTAGALQAGYGFAKTKWGGVAGAALFEAESLTDAAERALRDYHWHMVEAGDAKPARDGSAAPLRVGPTAGKRYRMRLERKGRQVRFHAVEEGVWEKDGESFARGLTLVKRFSNRKLEELVRGADGTARFRFVGLMRFELHDVRITGILDEDG